MHDFFQSNTLILVRIPKSGSESVSMMLRQPVDKESVVSLPQTIDDDAFFSSFEKFRTSSKALRYRLKKYGVVTDNQLRSQIAKREQEISLIAGHIHYGVVALEQKTTRYVTILRNPYDRVRSEYDYARAKMAKKQGRQFYQTKRLRIASNGDFESYLSFLLEHKSVFGNIATRFILGTALERDPAKHLKNAYFHYGTLENIDEFARELSEKLGIEPLTVPVRNVSDANSDRPALTPKQRAKIDEIYDLDLRCYEAIA